MSIVMRMTDRAKVTIGEVTFTIAPLSHEHKKEIANCTYFKDGKSHYDIAEAQRLLFKYGLKSVEGLKDLDGGEYHLSLNEDGNCSDESISEIFNIDERTKLAQSCWSLFKGISEDKKLLDENGDELEGVALELVSQSKPSG